MELTVLDLLKPVRERLEKLDRLLADPEVLSDQARYRDVARERSRTQELVVLGDEYEKILRLIADDKSVLAENPDGEVAEIARQELEELMPQKEKLERRLQAKLLPPDPEDSKNAIVEIRAGTGGEEAALFVADLFRMYSRYAESKGWRIDVMNSNPTGLGGFKEIIFSLEGDGVYGDLKYESGVHRVQRVPATEASGRVHTSAASVAVLPEAEEIELKIDPNELRIDVFRSSGPGGQSVNTTDSAVRITHIPTGTVVSCQDEKSQLKNKVKAMMVLRARLLDRLRSEQAEKVSKTRRTMIGSGDRSEKIRTYNFPQNRVTDHRIGLTIYALEGVMDGDLEELIESAKRFELEKRMRSVESGKERPGELG